MYRARDTRLGRDVALKALPESRLSSFGSTETGQLIVRNADDRIIRALKMGAAGKRRSAEAEHREILQEALIPRQRKGTLKDLLLDMPGVGDDDDFVRRPDRGPSSMPCWRRRPWCTASRWRREL